MQLCIFQKIWKILLLKKSGYEIKLDVLVKYKVFFSKFHIILLFSFIDPGQCQVLKVELKNDAYKSQSNRDGIYKLSSTVNGRPSWTKSESQAQYIYQESMLYTPLRTARISD